MKRCPECRRDYYDDSLLYCLDDGSALLEGPGESASSQIRSKDEKSTSHGTESPTIRFKEERADRSTGNSDRLETQRRLARNTWVWASIGIIAVLVVIAVTTIFLRSLKGDAGRASIFDRANIAQVTTSRNLAQTAISPDGKYLAYALKDREAESLWIRQSDVANDIQIIAPMPVTYEGLTFSRDSLVINLVTRDANGVSSLSSVPSLGGTVKRLMSRVDSPVTFSPDGASMAFVRGKFPSSDESALIVADKNGSSERVLAVKKAPQFFYPISNWTGPAWAPDNKLIVAAFADLKNGRAGNLSAFSISDGTEKKLLSEDFAEVGRAEWLADMSGLVFVGTQKFVGRFPGQVWSVTYPGGAVHKVTNDFGNYRALSMTADGSRIVTISFTELYALWIVTDGDSARAKQVIPVSRRGGVSWTPNGQIVYATTMNGRSDIWITQPDGTGRKQLTADSEQNWEPSVSPDGRFIAYFSTRDGKANVWRMNLDGSDQRALTRDLLTWQPSWSPDGRSVLFVTYPDWSLSSVPVDGGDFGPINDRLGFRPVVSPDGRFLACYCAENVGSASVESVSRLTLIPLNVNSTPLSPVYQGGQPDSSFAYLQWTPDSRSVLYNSSVDNVENIWSQPATGGPAVKLTSFQDAEISSFAISKDGHRLAVARGTIASDVVMITNSIDKR